MKNRAKGVGCLMCLCARSVDLDPLLESDTGLETETPRGSSSPSVWIQICLVLFFGFILGILVWKLVVAFWACD